MKSTFQCDICKRYYDDVNTANSCESTHVIIYPTWFWYIPVVTWFYIPFKVFTTKNSIVFFDKVEPKTSLQHIQSELKRLWFYFSPFLLLFLILLLNLK
jgi:hypothetical protein